MLLVKYWSDKRLISLNLLKAMLRSPQMQYMYRRLCSGNKLRGFPLHFHYQIASFWRLQNVIVGIMQEWTKMNVRNEREILRFEF